MCTLETELARLRQPLDQTVPLLAAFLSLPVPPERYAPLSLSTQEQKQQTLEVLLALLLDLAAQQPVLLIVEDLHWVDPSTLEWLSQLLDQVPTTRLGLLLTARPDFPVPWSARSHLTQLTLGRLARPHVGQMIAWVAGGKVLPAEIVQQLETTADGVPLFVEELTKTVLEADFLAERDDHYALRGPLPRPAIPATLQDALLARLDRLVEGKAVAQLGAVLGRTFPYAVLRAVSSLDELVLWRGLGQLVQAEVLYQHGVPPQAAYTFKHALIQEAAYQTLLRSTRQQYHQRTAQVLMELAPETVETQPELLAHHYTEAGLAGQAVAYWQRAGERSHGRSAYAEAVAHCTRGLAVLQALPDTTTRTQQELDLLLMLGAALAVSKGQGAPETGHVFARARERGRQVGDTVRLLAVLDHLRDFYLNRVQLQAARELDEESLLLAQRQHDLAHLSRAHRGLGITLYYMGALVPARTHLEQAVALQTSRPDRRLTAQVAQQGMNTLVPLFAYAGLTLLILGFPDHALTRIDEAQRWAQERPHAFNLARAWYYAAHFHQLRRDAAAAQQRAEASLALSTEQGFAHLVGPATQMRGWALAAQGQGREGLAQMHQGLAACRTMGAEIGKPVYHAMLAEAYGGMGQPEAGLRLLAEALEHVEHTGERYYEAEVYRLKGELLLQQAAPDRAQAEACFQHALTVARHQEAKLLELRAIMSLARLWQQQGKRQDAYDLLAPAYGWFTEGFDTTDLQEAKALLDALA